MPSTALAPKAPHSGPTSLPDKLPIRRPLTARTSPASAAIEKHTLPEMTSLAFLLRVACQYTSEGRIVKYT